MTSLIPEDKDVVLFEKENLLFRAGVFLVGTAIFNIKGWSSFSKIFSHKGIDCSLLRAGAAEGWQKGKLKIRLALEFVPDEIDKD